MRMVSHFGHSSSQIKPNSGSFAGGESLSMLELSSHPNTSRRGGNRGGRLGKAVPGGRGGGRVGHSHRVGSEVCGGSSRGGSITRREGCTLWGQQRGGSAHYGGPRRQGMARHVGCGAMEDLLY